MKPTNPRPSSQKEPCMAMSKPFTRTPAIANQTKNAINNFIGTDDNEARAGFNEHFEKDNPHLPHATGAKA